MSDLNLLPRSRREANDRRRAARRWAVWGCLWCTLLAAGQAVAVALRPASDAAPVEREIARLGDERARLDDEIARLKQSYDRSARSLAAARATVDHPDWSRLLTRIVQGRPAGLAFRLWGLQRGPQGALTLRLEGTVPDHASLTSFALTLEQLGVFRRVAIVTARSSGTRNEQGERRVEFALDAELIPTGLGGGSKP